MPAPDIIKAKLLFVDDDRTFLNFLHQTFLEFSHNQWDMECVTDAAAALNFLRNETVDLAVLDLRMPGVDGMQLLRMLKREFPAVQMAFLSGQGDEQARRMSLEEGAAMFLEKPASLAGMQSLFATINELARWQQRLGGRGVVRRAGLIDLVKMECKSRNSRLLEVYGADERGQIWIKEGAIIHALAPEKRGQSAFTHLICLPNAEVHLKPFAEPIERSVDREWEFLVLEAARVLEQTLNVPDAPPAPPAPSVAPVAPLPAPAPQAPVAAVPPPPQRSEAPSAPAPISPPPRATAGEIPLRMAPAPVAPVKLPRRSPPPVPRAQVPVAEPPVAAPVAPQAPRGSPVFPSLTAAPVSRQVVIEPYAAGLHIDEMLVCSERREVYYEWQCVETQKRLSLIDFIALKSRQLALGLPWGKFDRVEMQASTGRVVVQHQHNRFVFVRSNTRARSPSAEGHGDMSVQAWLAQQHPTRGVLAIGVTLADRKVLTQAFGADIGLSALNTAWPCLVDTFEAAARFQFSVWQLRWIYERVQLYCVRRADGASLGLILEKTPGAVDEVVIEQFFAEFQTLRVD